MRLFEQPDILLANTWIVVRIDGRGFSKYGSLFLSFQYFKFCLFSTFVSIHATLGPTRLSNTEGAYSNNYAAAPSFERRFLKAYLLIGRRLTTKYKFTKPNDRRALDLMNAAAEAVMKELPDLVLAYGNSDEFRYATLLGPVSRSV